MLVRMSSFEISSQQALKVLVMSGNAPLSSYRSLLVRDGLCLQARAILWHLHLRAARSSCSCPASLSEEFALRIEHFIRREWWS